MSVESTIKSLLDESRKLKEATQVSEANRVTQGAVPADGMKKIDSPDSVGGENEDNKRNNVDDEPEAKGGTSKKSNPATQGATAPEGMQKVKEEVTVDVTEDVNALFNGEDGLTEEFRQKAETIFEAAVVSRVKEEVARIEEQYSELVEARVEEIKEGLVDHIDGYLNLMVEQWMEQNEVALESGMKSDILENFVSGLKNLFAESYIEVPQEKFDVVADLEAKLEEATQKIDEVYALNVELRKQVNEHARLDIIAQVSEGLSDLEVGKFTTLAEEIAFEDRDTFAQKMQVIRENYFAKKPAKSGGADFLTEETIQEDKAEVPASMAQYVRAINMTAKR
jgi:hypothetical protein